MPIHVAITRRVLPGREEEFREELRKFFQSSFDRGSVMGAGMVAPPPGSDSREYGILRSFTNEQERDAFYRTPMFKQWDTSARALTEGDPEYRQLTGLEAWFRSPNPPPRWKMAVATLLGVFPTSLLLGSTVGPLTHGWPFPLGPLVFSILMVAMLTWVVMPLVTKFLHHWLHPQTHHTP